MSLGLFERLWARRKWQRGLEGKEGKTVKEFLTKIQGLRSAIIAVVLLAEFLAKSFGLSIGGPLTWAHQLFAIAGWDPKEALFDPTVTGTALLTIYATVQRIRAWSKTRSSLPSGALVLLVCSFGLLTLPGCGAAKVPTAPDVEASPPAPTQKIVSLAFTVRASDGRIVEWVGRDDLFTIESGPRCLLTELPCPRPSRVSWRVSGAFCEILGDITGPAVTVTCAGGGVTRVDAEDLDSGARGTAQIQVRF